MEAIDRFVAAGKGEEVAAKVKEKLVENETYR
jgi:hypothetical protein